MPVGVYGELLAERELHDGLVFTAPEEGRDTAQYGSDEADQCPKHRPILVDPSAKREPESRGPVGLSSTDEEAGFWKSRAESPRTNIGNTQGALQPA
jgi:hypothetical protein